ncbi:hypothetical protein C1I12_04035 [Listeria monocytogenes]|uniref:ABC-three component system protein n=1 Tax=Listeria monocytogenes TaxID=1639 RepID=UPI000C86B99F|nr:ABC-three component system protein [Listeria monocytogenes]EAK8914819.1 hypothetical protein [Listeria monocytogenes]EHH9781160.1 hypothetical protein [Listeria monocytogenes]EJL5247988.1 hypothetical protein [Listeria monocytogenes]EJL5248332.1 hypothetical protein [Listeria monocytogenes]EJL5268398.1 hypothetical protein [Listeria monocytogenes]
MSRLCFGTYAKAVQKVMKSPNGNKDVTELLLSLIIDNVEITNQSGDVFVVTDKMASDLLSFKINLQKKIVSASSDRVVSEAACDFFEDVVIPVLMPELHDDLVSDLSTIVSADAKIPAKKKEELLKSAQEDLIKSFLSGLFLYAIKLPNRQTTLDAYSDSDTRLSSAIADMKKLDEMLTNIPKPNPVAIPDTPSSDEMAYITELLAAYAEVAGKTELQLNELDSLPKYKSDLERRRKDYYAAETIREGTRDSFGDKEEVQFKVLKEETYEGIVDSYSQSYTDAFSRLTGVMSQAVLVPINRCLLSKLNWISGREKKGVCHFLVNDGQLKWVIDDD